MIKFSGEKLKKIRKKKQMSVRQLAEEVGTNRTSISRFETGKRVPSIEMVGRFCDYFNCTFYEFLEDVDNETK